MSMTEVWDLEIGEMLKDRYLLIDKLGDGGFGAVWEVEDLQANRDRKAVKVCTSYDPEVLALFRNEFLTLKGLDGDRSICDRIVKVESIYPKKRPPKGVDCFELHFFVMEKVAGTNLENLCQKLLELQNKQKQKFSFWKHFYRLLFCRYPPLRSPFSYLEIANWLEQLAEILQYLHSEKIAHHDLKPSNVMITPDGNIKLIDFGIAKLIDPESLKRIEEFDTKTMPRDHTPKYAAPEQEVGQGWLRSDFYSLGQTILFALTGQDPSKRTNDDWRLQFPPELATFLKQATDPNPVDRHADADELLHHAKRVVRSLRYQFGRWAVTKQMAVVSGIAAIATISTLGMRSTGVLQPLEFAAYDQMLAMRPDLGLDPNLAIIDMTYADFPEISDQDLVNVLNKLSQYQPRVIGINLQRDQQSKYTPESRILLKNIYARNPNIFGTCSRKDTKDKSAYPLIPSTSAPIGFDNALEDSDRKIRRLLFIYQVSPDNICQGVAAFSLLIAHKYLQIEYQYPDITNLENYDLGKALFLRLKARENAYQDNHEDRLTAMSSQFQIMIDYRSRQIAKPISAKELLAGQIYADLIDRRVVLIGRATLDRSRSKRNQTPYGEMMGIELVGQTISQLISAANNERPILKPASFMMDLVWMIGVSVVGGYMSWRVRSWIGKCIVMLILPSGLYLVCFVFLVTEGLWLGSVPIMIVAIVANIGLFLYNLYGYKLIGE